MKLILVRHGQSVWNKENKFTGWTDVQLSNIGVEEAVKAGKVLKENNFVFDIAYTSVLQRSIDTLKYILKELNEENIKVKSSWKLNERHYGALQGLNKDDIRKKYGEKQLNLWRRSVNIRPPALKKDDIRYSVNDIKYKNLRLKELPLTENLLDTSKRVVEYWNSDIREDIQNNKKVLIVAHGNSIRALMRYLDDLSDEEVVNLEIQTGNPICYEFDDNLKVIKHYYLIK